MAQLPFNIFVMLSVPGMRRQVTQAVEALSKKLTEPNALGQAYKICDLWQHRLELALRSEIPDWAGLAAFRHSIDYELTQDVITALKQAKASGPSPAACLPELSTLAECWQAYDQYFNHENRELHSGKFLLKGEAAEWFQAQIKKCKPRLGGQAGNILWLWECIGADARACSFYLSKDLVNLAFKPAASPSISSSSSTSTYSPQTRRDGSPVSPQTNHLRSATLPTSPPPPTREKTSLARSQFLWLNGNKSGFKHLTEAVEFCGISQGSNGVAAAPTWINFTIAQAGRRLIYQLPGFRPLTPEARQVPEGVQFFYQNQPLLEHPLRRCPEINAWPAVPLFAEYHLNPEQVLEITLADKAQLTAALMSQVDYAVIGGMDAILYDPWFKTELALQDHLLSILEEQLTALAEGGVRIGMELSGVPRPTYAGFLKNLCRKNIVIALGINGIDELPWVIGEANSERENDWKFDPQELPDELRTPAATDDHFDYLTYRRAKKLAQTTQVRTLYVHTETLDFILRRDADPGALLRSQLGDLMGKGFVIAALLQRNYGPEWVNHLKKMPPAVNPEAMAHLGQFASDFKKYENLNGSQDRLLTSGYWLATSPNAYSVAVVPIVWPPVSDQAVKRGLPKDMNPTGAGDMTFGAFFFLGGV